MENLIYTYAFLKTLYDRGEDYLDSFWPFVIQVIPDKETRAKYQIQRDLKIKSNLEIPSFALESILERAIAKGYVKLNRRDQYLLTEEGIQFRDELEPEDSVKRRVNFLVEDIREFFNSHSIFLESDEVFSSLNSFIKTNIEPLLEYLSPNREKNEDQISKNSSIEQLLVEYIKEAKQNKPQHYEVLKDLIFGSIILGIGRSPDFKEVYQIRESGFKSCSIYLDTNILFSLFELHPPSLVKPTIELFNLIKQNECKVRIFNFTLNELVMVLNNYHPHSLDQPFGDDVYSVLAQKGWNKSDVNRFISEIDDHLSKFNIEIDTIPDINLESYVCKDSKLCETIRIFKPYDNRVILNHDLAAVEQIKNIRGTSIRRLEEAKATFLTSDQRLTRFCYYGMDHVNLRTIPEVLLDKFFTTILWLKNPKADISLLSVISAHSKGIFTKWRIWDKFFQEIQKLKAEGRVREDQITTLFYHNYIDGELRSLEEEDSDRITPEYIINKIENAQKFVKEEKEKEIIAIKEEQEADFKLKLINVKKNYENSVNGIFLSIKICIILLLIVVIPLYYLYSGKWAILQNNYGLLTALIAAVGIIFALDWHHKLPIQQIITKKLVTKWENRMKPLE